MRTHTVMASPLGELTLVAEDGALVRCSMVLPGSGSTAPGTPAKGAGTGTPAKGAGTGTPAKGAGTGTRARDSGDPGADEGLGERDDAGLADAAAQLTEYFAGERTEFTMPLAPRGDAFQLKVWALLREIPYGQTRSYGQLARSLGDVNLSQAVGWANGRNPISIIVPCHRVIGADGTLVGYAGGLDRKRFLLALEEPPAEEAHRLF